MLIKFLGKVLKDEDVIQDLNLNESSCIISLRKVCLFLLLRISNHHPDNISLTYHRKHQPKPAAAKAGVPKPESSKASSGAAKPEPATPAAQIQSAMPPVPAAPIAAISSDFLSRADSASVDMPDDPEFDANLQRLLQLGFGRDEAAWALSESEGDVETAADLLMAVSSVVSWSCLLALLPISSLSLISNHLNRRMNFPTRTLRCRRGDLASPANPALSSTATKLAAFWPA